MRPYEKRKLLEKESVERDRIAAIDLTDYRGVSVFVSNMRYKIGLRDYVYRWTYGEWIKCTYSLVTVVKAIRLRRADEASH